jgi:hypothetical protein
MAKRAAKKAAAKVDAQGERLRHALAKRTKAELIDALMELAEADQKVRRQLDARFKVEAPPDELVAATRRAIVHATAFDKRDINRNFDYDYAAYDEVQRNLARLVRLGRLRPALELSLELMKAGSYQVEMSDKGMMAHDIEECLEAILEAVKTSDLPTPEKIAWCEKMIKSDRMGFICAKELKSLRTQFEPAKT